MKQGLIGVLAMALLWGCGNDPGAAGEAKQVSSAPAATATAVNAAAETEDSAETASARLASLVEAYFEENLELNPVSATFIGDSRYNDRLGNSIGPEHRAAQLAMERRFLEAAAEIDGDALEDQDLLTLEVFMLGRREAIEGSEFPAYLLPINQMFSMPSLMAMLGSGRSAQPFATVTDYDNFLGRIDDFTVWVDQAIANMREGVEKGVVQPRVIMEKVLPQLAAHVVDEPEQSLFWGPVAAMPEGFSEEDRVRLTAAYRDAIAAQIVPAYSRLDDFIESEYMPHTRESVAWAELPDGADWYAYRARVSTTTTLSAREIHELGLAEVARIRSEMEQVRDTVGFEGDLAAFFEYLKTDDAFYYDNAEDLLDGYRDLKNRIDALLPALFSDFPAADYEIREVEAFRAQSSAGASYQRPAPDGSRPGIFYVNTHNLRAQPKYGMETLSLHEASPGHHFQISIQQELTDLPRFRRFGGYTAYVEGWALYAESLGRELGLFTDPYQYYGKLNDEQLRAMRLVVDTGLHTEGWSREQAIAFMLENSSLAESDVVAEVERYIAIPGQALSYKIGQIKILELRARAEQKLGEKFDVKAFHSMVLRGGALPMAVLEARTERWIAARM